MARNELQEPSGWRFRGFTHPNTTSIPDEYFDFVSPRLNGSEVKLMNYLMRRTYGFKKESDAVSISQMLHGIVRRDGSRLDEGCGLAKSSILAALNSLEAKGLIVRRRQIDFRGGFLATNYTVNRQPDPLGLKSDQGGVGRELDQGVGRETAQALAENPPKPLVQNPTIQVTVNTLQLDKNVNVAKATRTPANVLHELADQPLAPEHLALIASDILAALGDRQSAGFYRLVARKVPEALIRRTLAELKDGHAQSPARVFTKTMLDYARQARGAAAATALAADRQALAARLTRP